VADKIDEIIEALSRDAIERNDDPSYITREYVYRLLGQANKTADEWFDSLMRLNAYSAAMKPASKEERARMLREMPACTLIRLYGPGDGSRDPEFEAAGVYERAKREFEADLKAHKENQHVDSTE
jgi:hypothetical protein